MKVWMELNVWSTSSRTPYPKKSNVIHSGEVHTRYLTLRIIDTYRCKCTYYAGPDPCCGRLLRASRRVLVHEPTTQRESVIRGQVKLLWNSPLMQDMIVSLGQSDVLEHLASLRPVCWWRMLGVEVETVRVLSEWRWKRIRIITRIGAH